MKHGDIIFVDFDPTKGREQAGHRSAVVISRTEFNDRREFALVCPITNTIKDLRLRVHLDDRTETTGDVICEQVRTTDNLVRKHKVVEQLPRELLEKVLETVSVIVALNS